MGLFGKSKNELLEEERQKKELAEKKEQEWQLTKAFRDRKDYVIKQDGIIVNIQGKASSHSEAYKLIQDEDAYVFLYNISACYDYGVNSYEDILAQPDIRFEKNNCNVELLPVEEKCTPSATCAGEVNYVANPICLEFADLDGNSLMVEITDMKQDFGPFSELLQKTGVKNFRNVIDIPEESFAVKVINGNGFLSEDEYVFARTKEYVMFVRDSANYTGKKVSVARIGLDDILYYKSEGALRYEQNISGGGGGGVNYSAAFLGGFLFGGVGALIGSRHGEEIKEVKTTTIEHDDRIVSLAVKAGSVLYQIGFSINSEFAFEWLLPDKQYDYVISKRREMYES